MKTKLVNTNRILSVALLLSFLTVFALAPFASATYVALNKQHSPMTDFTVGDQITFTITLDVKTNVGGSQVPITNLNITDTLPAGLSYYPGSASSTPSASFSAVGQVLTWSFGAGSLSGAPQATVTFVATANGDVLGSLMNSVSAEYLESGETYSNPSATDTVNVLAATTPPESSSPPTTPDFVGGESVPLNMIQLLSPYLIVAALGASAIVALVLCKKRVSS